MSQGTEVGYNVQLAVDGKHKLIVEYAVTNAVTDRDQLAPMALQAKTPLGVDSVDAVTDVGYYDGEQVMACLEAGITPYVAKPPTSRNQKAGLFTKADVVYGTAQDTYQCPAGATLTYRFTADEAGRPTRYYATPACGRCPLRAECTRSRTDGRRITRWEHEGLLDAMAARVRTRPELMRQRKQLVEHPFGTMKRSMQQEIPLLRGLEKVRAEMSLMVLAYNLTRLVNIVGVERLLAVVMLTVHDDSQTLFEAIKAGAQGYLVKNVRSRELLEQLRGLVRGEAAISRRMAARILEEIRGQTGPFWPEEELTAREMQVLELVAARLSNAEIAGRLLVSEHTIKNHMKSILSKLHLRNRHEAAAYGVARGWLPRPRRRS